MDHLIFVQANANRLPKLFGILKSRTALTTSDGKIMRETSNDRLDSKVFQHSDSSARLTVSSEDMQAFFKTEKKSNANHSTHAPQFLDLGGMDELYGGDSNRAANHLPEQKSDLRAGDWAGDIVAAGKQALENVGKELSRFIPTDSHNNEHHVHAEKQTGHSRVVVEPPPAFHEKRVFFPERIDWNVPTTKWTIDDLDKYLVKHDGQEQYFWHLIPAPEIDHGFDQANAKLGKETDPNFHINSPDKKVLSLKEMDRIATVGEIK